MWQVQITWDIPKYFGTCEIFRCPRTYMPKQPNLWPVQDMDHSMIDILGSDRDLGAPAKNTLLGWMFSTDCST